MRHPKHDDVAATARGWYRRSFPEMGYHVERERYGWYSSNAASRAVRLVTVGDLSPDNLPALFAEARDRFPDTDVTIVVDDRAVDDLLGPALVSAGCRRENATIYLAHVGALPDASAAAGIQIVLCDEALLLRARHRETQGVR